MSYTPNFSKLDEDKFRIFVDGSYNQNIGMGAIGCCFPQTYRSREIVSNENSYSKLFQAKSSVDMELKAIEKGIEILKILIQDNPFLKENCIAIKNDCIFVVNQIYKGKRKNGDETEYTEEQMLLMRNLSQEIKSLKENGILLKLSYIPKKLNFAHHYCYNSLRKKFEQICGQQGRKEI